MAQILDRVAENPFQFYECFSMAMPLGKKVVNLKELLEGLREVDESILFYHLIQSRLTLDHPAVEYPQRLRAVGRQRPAEFQAGGEVQLLRSF